MRARGRTGAFGVLGLGLSLVLGAGCISDPPVPGDEALGHFVFTATRVDDRTCAFAELDDNASFGFEGTFSRLQSGEGAWFTVNGISREGYWDGQVFESPFTAARGFSATMSDGGICDNQYDVRENLEVALLSQSQDALLGNDCPQDPSWLLQPGGPPVDVDAGVILPSSTKEGFDATRACGFLVEDIPSSAECAVAACTLVYRVEGVRKR